MSKDVFPSASVATRIRNHCLSSGLSTRIEWPSNLSSIMSLDFSMCGLLPEMPAVFGRASWVCRILIFFFDQSSDQPIFGVDRWGGIIIQLLKTIFPFLDFLLHPVNVASH